MPLLPGVSGRKGEGIPHLSPYEGYQLKGTFWISNNQHLFLWVPGSSTVSTYSPDSEMGKPNLRENEDLVSFSSTGNPLIQPEPKLSFPQGMRFYPFHHLLLTLIEGREGVQAQMGS